MHGIVIDWIAHNARNYPDKTALIELPSNRQYTYREFHQRVGKVAALLTQLGVDKGDRVGVLALNSADMLALIFATWRIGAVHLALNFRLTAPELDFIIGNAEPKVVVYDQALQSTIDQLSVVIPETIATEGQGAESPFESALLSLEPVSDMVALSPDALCMLMYSSGTTGTPKGVMITHGNWLWGQINSATCMYYNPDMVSFAVMPLFHIGGLQLFTFPALYAGGKAVVMRSFDPGAALAVFSDPNMGVTHFLGVPAIYNALRDHPDNASSDFSSLVIPMAGAEAVPESLVKWWFERGVAIQEAYGMTENMTTCCSTQRSDVPNRIGSAGRALPHTQVKIMRDSKTPAGINEAGELWCRGPTVTPGYWQRPEANAESFVDGWLRSGDVARMDAEGYIYLEDRVKDMYISGGENVYPAEVENLLYQLPQISEVAVIGVPDEKWGETGKAIVALKEGQSLSVNHILDFCQGKLARFKQPASVVFVDSLPRTATGKVKKFELREQYR